MVKDEGDWSERETEEGEQAVQILSVESRGNPLEPTYDVAHWVPRFSYIAGKPKMTIPDKPVPVSR